MTSEEELEALATRIVSWCLGPHSLYPDAAKFAEAESRVRTSLSELIRQRDDNARQRNEQIADKHRILREYEAAKVAAESRALRAEQERFEREDERNKARVEMILARTERDEARRLAEAWRDEAPAPQDCKMPLPWER